MRVALIAPPYIPVPPIRYGGTELFIAQLATELKKLNIDVVIYGNGESTPDVELRYIYEKSEWPLPAELDIHKDLNHCAWAVRDAAESCDIVHLNSAAGLVFSRFIKQPFVYTLHHAEDQRLHDFYSFYPDVFYVAISQAQCNHHPLPFCRTIHHGLDMSRYTFKESKQHYLSFLGRIAPVKGVEAAIEVAQKSGIPLKIAGEIQPAFREYFDTKVKPHIDGKFIEYVGEADLAAKNELLGNSMAMLFPIAWNEPFGIVMIEAMACGTPVLAHNKGSVPEVVRDGVSGYICNDPDDMAERCKSLSIAPSTIRAYVEEKFSVARMAELYALLYRDIYLSEQRASEWIRETTTPDDVENTAA